VSTDDQLQKLREDLVAQIKAKPDMTADAPPPPQPAKFPPHAPLPVGTQSLLDAQLGEALKIMRDYTDWVHSPSVPMEECMNAGDAIARMMTASATLAAVAVRFQKGEPESRHRMIVEYAEPNAPEGEGSAKSRKRINHGNG